MSAVDRVSRYVDEARAAWAAVEIDRQSFIAYAQERDADLSSSTPGELYLACGCATGVPAAVDAFVREYGGLLRAVVARRVPRSSVEDVVQDLCNELLVGRDGVPAISKYAGRGK